LVFFLVVECIAAARANKGENYWYPMTCQFFKRY
jgi:uncharacterized Tic20 family protein